MGKPLRVLIIEDSEDDALLILRRLQKGGYAPEYERVETAEAMRLKLAAGGWDLVIADYKLPSFDGFAALEICKETAPDIPFILVSGAVGEEIAVEIMKAGAHDYIMKDKLVRLVPAVERELRDAESRARRRQAEAEIAKARRDWEEIFQAISHPTFILDPQYNIIAANEAAARAAGINATEMAGRKCYEIFHAEASTSPPEGCPMLKLMAADHAHTVEAEMEAFGRNYIVCCTPVFDERGQLSKVIHIATDITQRSLAEQALKESEERYRGIFENAQEAIYRSTPDGRIIMANPAMARMFRYNSPEEMINNIRDIARQHYVDASDREIIKAILEKQGFVRNYETQYVRRDGSVFWASINMHTVCDEQGNIVFYEGIDEDITERKEGQERIRKALGATVQAIAAAVEKKDPYTAGHQRRTANLARSIAEVMGLNKEERDFIVIAATIHDIGKISIPAEILSKPARLTNIEFRLIMEHPQHAYDILKGIKFGWPVAEVILQHHERMDGSGYPNKMKGTEILLGARILSVADVVEAISSHRPYRPALGIGVALDEIEKNRGVLYDEDVVDVCLEIIRNRGVNFFI